MTINDAFVNAILADASYVPGLTPGMEGDDLIKALSGRMPSELAEYIAANFSVVTAIDTCPANQHKVERFETATGDLLLESQVQNLVNAMAAFTPPAPGQTTLPAEYAAQLNPVIAANWQ